MPCSRSVFTIGLTSRPISTKPPVIAAFASPVGYSECASGEPPRTRARLVPRLGAPSYRLSRVFLMEPRDVLPADVLHERIDVLRRRRPVIHVIRMLVHVEGEDRTAPGETVRVIGRPLIDELPVARRIGQEHPARAAAHRLAHGDKLGPPSLEGAEVPHEGLAQRPIWLALGAEAVEVQLV